MSEQWTKGPWTLETTGAGISFVSSLNTDSNDICDLYHTNQPNVYPKANATANGHLISAAPDMAEALAGSAAHLQKVQEAALDFLNSETIAAKGDLLTRLLALVIGDELREVQSATAAALAKARGQS